MLNEEIVAMSVVEYCDLLIAMAETTGQTSRIWPTSMAKNLFFAVQISVLMAEA